MLRYNCIACARAREQPEIPIHAQPVLARSLIHQFFAMGVGEAAQLYSILSCMPESEALSVPAECDCISCMDRSKRVTVSLVLAAAYQCTAVQLHNYVRVLVVNDFGVDSSRHKFIHPGYS